MSDGAREFDIILFGATGFVGRLTARHLAAVASPGLRIALAGVAVSELAGARADALTVVAGRMLHF